jgi:transposase
MVIGVCLQCQGERLVKNGSAAGKPKKRCKQCGYQFTRTTPRGKPLATKINAALWYLSGMSTYRIAFLLRVSTQAVLTWIRDLATDYYERPEPTGRTIVLQRDEIWHYLKLDFGHLRMEPFPIRQGRTDATQKLGKV